MEFKGTKGKWVVEINETGTYIICENKDICMVAIENKTPNSLLISKAPELLELLIELYNDKETYSNLFPDQQIKLKELIKEAIEIK